MLGYFPNNNSGSEEFMDYWYKIPKYLNQAVTFAFDMKEKYPDSVIVSLGQSPAWIVHGLGMIRKLNREYANVGYIPFTGNFFKRAEDDVGDQKAMHYYAHEEKYPDKETIGRYLDYCGMYELKPLDLLKMANKGKKVVLAEMIKSGSGLASFLSVWTSQLDPETIERISKAIQFYVYDTQPNANKDELVIHNLDGSTYSFPLTKKVLNFQEAEIMQNTSSLNVCVDDSSRLVSIFRLRADCGEDRGGLNICNNSPKVKEIRGVLYREIEKRVRHPEMAPEEALML